MPSGSQREGSGKGQPGVGGWGQGWRGSSAGLGKTLETGTGRTWQWKGSLGTAGHKVCGRGRHGEPSRREPGSPGCRAGPGAGPGGTFMVRPAWYPVGLRPPWSQAAEQAEGEGLPFTESGKWGGVSTPPSHPLAEEGQSLLLARSAGTYGAGAPT